MGMWWFEPGAARWEARMLAICAMRSPHQQQLFHAPLVCASSYLFYVEMLWGKSHNWSFVLFHKHRWHVMLRCDLCPNFLSQIRQGKFLMFSWIKFWWILKRRFVTKVLLHTRQPKSLVFSCNALWCDSSSLLQKNPLLQITQLKFLIFSWSRFVSLCFEFFFAD